MEVKELSGIVISVLEKIKKIGKSLGICNVFNLCSFKTEALFCHFVLNKKIEY